MDELEQQWAALVEQLTRQTLAGKLLWEQTATPGCWQTSLPGQIVHLCGGHPASTTPMPFTLQFWDHQRRAQGTWWAHLHEAHYAAMAQLYTVVKDGRRPLVVALERLVERLQGL